MVVAVATLTTPERILDAALAVMSAHGLARLSLEDVAQQAHLSRQTVYRHFGSREALVTAVIVREERALLDRIVAAAAPFDELRPALAAAMSAGLRAARQHPLLDRLLATEPEALLPFLTTGAGPVLSAARPALEALFTGRKPHVAPARVRRAADATTRLFISYAINPPEEDPDRVAADLAALILHGVEGAGD